jgi:hypothetical protein
MTRHKHFITKSVCRAKLSFLMHSCINLTRALQQNQNETGPRRLSRRPPYDLRVIRLLDDLHTMQIDHSNVSVAVSAILQFTVDQNVDQFVDDILEMFHAHLLAEVLVVVELKKQANVTHRHLFASVRRTASIAVKMFLYVFAT